MFVLIVVSLTAKHFLKPLIESRVSSGAAKGSWWMAVGVGVLGMIVVMALVVGIAFLFGQTPDTAQNVALPSRPEV